MVLSQLQLWQYKLLGFKWPVLDLETTGCEGTTGNEAKLLVMAEEAACNAENKIASFWTATRAQFSAAEFLVVEFPVAKFWGITSCVKQFSAEDDELLAIFPYVIGTGLIEELLKLLDVEFKTAIGKELTFDAE